MMHLNDAAGFAVKSGRSESADFADRPVDPKTKKPIAGVSLTPANDCYFDGAFSQRPMIRRTDFINRIVAVQLCHGRKNRYDKLAAGFSYCIVFKTGIDIPLFRDNCKSAVVYQPVIRPVCPVFPTRFSLLRISFDFPLASASTCYTRWYIHCHIT